MKGTGKRALVLTLVLALAGFVLVGCGGSGTQTQSDSSGTQAQNDGETAGPALPSLENVVLQWQGYTMGFDLVTNDPDTATPAGMDVDGQAIKVCFKYLSSADNSGGFVAETLFEDLEAEPIVLRDTEGTVHTYTGAIGDFLLKGNIATDGFAMEDLQPRVSITFDVPANLSLEDFTLVIGEQEVQLTEFISDEYAADRSE